MDICGASTCWSEQTTVKIVSDRFLQYEGHHKLCNVYCRQLTYCLLVYIHKYIQLLLDILNLCFVLTSCFLFAFLPSLSASASLPHIDIPFLVSFLTDSGFFHYPQKPLGIVFFLLNMFCPASPSTATLIAICPTGALYAGFICSLLYFFHQFLSFPYLVIPNPT